MRKLKVLFLAAVLLTAFAVPALADFDGKPTDAQAKQGTWRCGKAKQFYHQSYKTYSYVYLTSINKWLGSADNITEGLMQGAVDNYNYVCAYYYTSTNFSAMKSYYY